MIKKLVFPILTLCLCAGLANADESSVKKELEKRFKQPIESVTKAGYLGLYEAFDGRRIFYVDKDVKTVIDGTIFDLVSRKNVTEERLNTLTAIDFAKLPLKQAIKFKRGDGSRILATFEDPNCGYCKRLAKTLQKMDDITVYTFLIPILGPDSLKKTQQILCAKDSQKTWLNWIVDGEKPAGKSECEAAKRIIATNMKMQKDYFINGTPAIFFPDGQRFAGAAPAELIEHRLQETNSKK